MTRTAKIDRETKETNISIELNLDGSGQHHIESPVPFFNHMLSALSRHGFFDLTVKATGDTAIDAHHTVEDIGISLGLAFAKALSDKKGIYRYGHAYVPLDESLSRVVIDFSGRPGLFGLLLLSLAGPLSGIHLNFYGHHLWTLCLYLLLRGYWDEEDHGCCYLSS